MIIIRGFFRAYMDLFLLVMVARFARAAHKAQMTDDLLEK